MPGGAPAFGRGSLLTPVSAPAGLAPATPAQGRPAPFAPREVECTAAQRRAEFAADVLQGAGKKLGEASLYFYGGMAVAAGLEGPTAGTDTPITVAFASAGASLSTASLLCGTLAAALRGYAFNDHIDSLFQSLDVALDRLGDVLGLLAAARVPGVGGIKETVNVTFGAMQEGRQALITIKRTCRPAQG
jgi:hypothetical protein